MMLKFLKKGASQKTKAPENTDLIKKQAKIEPKQPVSAEVTANNELADDLFASKDDIKDPNQLEIS